MNVPPAPDLIFEQHGTVRVVRPAQPRYTPRPIEEAMRADTLPYLVKGLFGDGDFGLLFGESTAGKSFLAIRLAYAVARGEPFLGRATRQAPVFYICAEGAGGFGKRIAAAQREYGAPGGRIFYSTDTAALHRDGAAVEDLIAGTRKVGARLVLLDTMARLTPGADENSFEDVSAFIAAAQRVQQETGATVIPVCHTAKSDKRAPRGHTSLFAAADFAVGLELIEDDKTHRRLRIAKAKDDEGGSEYTFELRQVLLGTDGDGDPITSCVVSGLEAADAYLARTSAERKPRGPTGASAVALKALRNAVADHGRAAPLSLELPAAVQVVEVEQWRQEFYRTTVETNPDKKQDTRRKAFDRATTNLSGSGFACIRDRYAWVARDDAA